MGRRMGPRIRGDTEGGVDGAEEVVEGPLGVPSQYASICFMTGSVTGIVGLWQGEVVTSEEVGWQGLCVFRRRDSSTPLRFAQNDMWVMGEGGRKEWVPAFARTRKGGVVFFCGGNEGWVVLGREIGPRIREDREGIRFFL